MFTEKELRYKDSILSRLVNEYQSDLTDSSITTALKDCVAGKRLIEISKRLRDAGQLTIQMLRAEMVRFQKSL